MIEKGPLTLWLKQQANNHGQLGITMGAVRICKHVVLGHNGAVMMYIYIYMYILVNHQQKGNS